MKLKLTFLAVLWSCLSHTVMAQQPIMGIVKKDHTIELYDYSLRQKIASTTDSLSLVLQKTGGTINPTPNIQGGQVYVPTVGYVALPVLNPDFIATGSSADEVVVLRGDTAWLWAATGWIVIPTDFQHVRSFDLIHYDGHLYVAFADSGAQHIGAQNVDDTLPGIGVSYPADSVEKVFFLKNSSYTYSDQHISIGALTLPFGYITVSGEVCDSTWCMYLPPLPKLNLDYITAPKRLGLDSGEAYRIYEVQTIATPKTAGAFTTALDVPLVPVYEKTNYFLSLKTKYEAPLLNGVPQRLLLHRIQYSGCGVQNTPWNFDLGFVRYQDDNTVVSGDARDNGSHRVNTYDSLGRYVASFPLTDSHDGQVIDSFTVAFKYIDYDSFYITPPLVINNNTGVEYSPAPNQLYPLLGDSCIIASGAVLFPGQADIDHGNSVQMTWIPQLGKYLLLRSARNLALYPLSYPLCAWLFDPNSGQVVLATQLIHLINQSPFAFGRDGGHDFQIEPDFSNPAAGVFMVSQYDNVVCDDPISGPSRGYTALLQYTAGNWSISDIRTFVAPPSIAMGSIDVYKSANDTFVVISTAGGVNGADAVNNPQIVIYDYTPKNRQAQIAIKTREDQKVVAYQFNAAPQFAVPTFTMVVSETPDSLYVTADLASLPEGEWFWWLGNIPVTETLQIAKNILGAGCPIYISGQYSTADTVPGIPESCLPNRWISDPQWLQGTVTGLDKDVADLENISIYPNPAHDQLYINGAGDVQHVVVYDILGGQYIESQQQQTINISQLPKGMFLIKIVTKNGELVKKFIKQ